MSKKNNDFTEEKSEKRKEYLKKYRETHKKEISEYYKKYYEANKEKHKKCARKYREAHREELEEAKRKYYETHKEEQCKKRSARYYSRKNKFHGLDVYSCIARYYTEDSHHCKMSRYFSSLENYISFLLNPDINLKLSLINNMRLGKISEQDALDVAVPLTEEDLEYIRDSYMNSKYSKERQ